MYQNIQIVAKAGLTRWFTPKLPQGLVFFYLRDYPSSLSFRLLVSQIRDRTGLVSSAKVLKEIFRTPPELDLSLKTSDLTNLYLYSSRFSVEL